MKTSLIVGALLVLVAGCGGTEKESAPKTFDVAGRILLTSTTDRGVYTDAIEPKAGDSCSGSGGYDDLSAGVSAVVRDSKGEKLALGSISAGTVEGVGSFDIVTCEFSFTVPDVPIQGDIYSVQIASRDEVEFKRSDAGDLVLTIG